MYIRGIYFERFGFFLVGNYIVSNSFYLKFVLVTSKAKESFRSYPFGARVHLFNYQSVQVMLGCVGLTRLRCISGIPDPILKQVGYGLSPNPGPPTAGPTHFEST